MKIKMMTANGSAWRAVYLFVNDRQVAHLGVDPNDGVKPVAFGGVLSHGFRVGLPHVPWRSNAGSMYVRAYKASSMFWHKVDGRYGWGRSVSKT